MLEREREQVAAAARRLAAAGLVSGTSGNISARKDDQVAITPTGGVLAELEPQHVTVVDLDGAVLDGAFAPTSEIDLHLRLYGELGTGAVVHYEMLALGGSARVAPYETFGTRELADAVLQALEGRTAALMANHGAVSHGTDLAVAVRATELLEWAATVYWNAHAIGTPRVLDETQQQAVVDAAVARRYGQVQPAEKAPS
jgi:L-fuculose-phosphate aldolase